MAGHAGQGTQDSRRALERRARERLHRIEEVRDVAALLEAGYTQGQVAELLGITQPRVHRIKRLLELWDCDVAETPEEIILRATVEHTDRGELVERLSRFAYTFGEPAPSEGEGYVRGTWDQVGDAVRRGYLSTEEYQALRAHSAASQEEPIAGE